MCQCKGPNWLMCNLPTVRDNSHGNGMAQDYRTTQGNIAPSQSKLYESSKLNPLLSWKLSLKLSLILLSDKCFISALLLTTHSHIVYKFGLSFVHLLFCLHKV